MKNIQQAPSRGIYLNAFGVIAIIGILTLALWPKSVNVTIEKDCPDGKVVTEKTQALKQASAKLSDAQGQVAKLTTLIEAKEEDAFAHIGSPNDYDGAKIGGVPMAKVKDYVNRYKKLAQTEQKKYGIPASISLAQGILESNSGQSVLTKENNNHFGVKCFSKKCKKGHCSNFKDDSHKDFFRNYETNWESWRDHSLLLQKDNYKNCRRCNSNDFRCWAAGLKKAGYATNPQYDELLIRIIENEHLKLYLYDIDN